MIRKRLQFYGRVQGVGFRFTAIRVANGLGITGWVRNERDGSVTVEAQGEDFAIDRMIQMIKDGGYIRVDRIAASELPLIEGENGFNVKYN